MADVILVQPRIGEWDIVRSHPSLPLALLSAVRLVDKEFEAVLIDTRLDKDWKPHLISELKKNPLCVGITSMTGRQIKYALEIAMAVKENSEVPVVWGGIHASIFPKETLENRYVDFVVKGEGEETFLNLLRTLKDKGSYANIAGLWHKENDLITGNRDTEFCGLDKFGYLPYHLVDLDRYLPIFMGRRTLYLETSRGCPNRCTYCYNKSYNDQKWRAQSPAVSLRHIKELVREKNINSFYIIDDNFFVDLRRAREICEGIVKERLDIYWEAQGITIQSALKMDDDYISLLEKSGLKKVHFGAESGSGRILKLVHKNISVSDIIKVNRKFKKHNIILQYNFMSGFPTETTDDIKATIRLCFDLMADNPRALISPICPYTPYPGTELYAQALELGFKRRTILEDWIESDYGDNIWASRQRMALLKRLFFASMFLDSHRVKDMIESDFLKIVINIYRPIAKFRLKNMFFAVMPELFIKDLIFRD